VTSEKPLWSKDIVGWSLYDFANTIYSMNIVSRYLKLYIIEDLGYDDRYFDIPYSLSMAVAALLMPALGALSDHSTKKRFFLLLFTLTCCGAVGTLAIVPPALLAVTIILFVIANFAYEAGQPFYNALLYSVADGSRARFVSGIGVGLGYVGAILGLILTMPFVTGAFFGHELPFFEAGGKIASFAPTAVLFAVFSLPLFLWVKERPVVKKKKTSLRAAYREVWDAIRQTKKYPGVVRFLVADYFIEDAVAVVIINMGVFCTAVIGLNDSQITLFLVITPIAAVIGSVVIGKLCQHLRLKRMLNIIVIGWAVVLAAFVFAEAMWLVWVLGSLIGILLGGLMTVTRPLLAEMVPREELGRFFGLFSLSGRAAAIFGPLIWTAIVYLFQPDRPLGAAAVDVLGIEGAGVDKLPYRMAVMALVGMILIGLYILRRVPEPEPNQHA
jgi:UMF1 family MFS transporter